MIVDAFVTPPKTSRFPLKSLPAPMTLRVVSAAFVMFVCSSGVLPGAGRLARSADYTPESPEVIEICDRLADYLENGGFKKTENSFDNVHEGAYGELALSGYAHYKYRGDPEHPVVKTGVDAARKFVRGLDDPAPNAGSDKTVYAAAICGMLLAEVDPAGFKNDLAKLNRHFNDVRRSHGGYTYRSFKAGDVSQTQYAMLALWKFNRLGVGVNGGGVKDTAKWLLAVQDRDGGWPYHGELYPGGQRGDQSGVTPSMAVAGGSAILIAGDIMNIWGASFGNEDANGVPGLPEAVRKDVGDTGSQRQVQASLPKEPMVAAIRACDSWLVDNSPDPGELKSKWPYYQLYTMERYYSFREVALEIDEGDSPSWYNDGVEYIREHVSSNGLPKTSYTTNASSSAFGILFLIRSTKRSIKTVSGGALIGGQGLPDDPSDIKVERGQVKTKRGIAASVTDLLGILEEDGADDLADKAIPDDLKLAEDPADRAAQIDRLKRLARGSRSWQARRVAMRLLAQSDDMEVVPTLIYGLSDNDKAARRYARDGLRFISRKFDGFDMPDDPTTQEVFNAERAWKRWYLTMNPTYVFLD